MPDIKVELSIGYATAIRKDVIHIYDDEWRECKTDEERDELMHEYWDDWKNNYVEASYELVK